MRVIVVGLGVQGLKRQRLAGGDFVASVDPVNKQADFRSIEQVKLADYDAALLCVPDKPKLELLSYLVEHGKHALVEKPLWVSCDEDIQALERAARSRGVVVYTAYNHRFEP